MAKFAKPECPVGFHGYHQYERSETRASVVWTCRLCERTLVKSKKLGTLRERKPRRR